MPSLKNLTNFIHNCLSECFYKFKIFNFFNKTLGRIPHGWRIFIVFSLTFVAGLCSYSFISTGHELILHLLDAKTAVWMLLVILIVRATLTLCANSNRVTGGIFLPLMAVGALVSSLLSALLGQVFGLDGSYHTVILVLGITACIAGMMKMPLTAIVFAVEALSCYDNVIYVIVAAGVAFLITEIFGAESINDRVLENLVHEINAGKTPEIIDRYVPVKRGAFAIGMQVRDIFWPTGLFVLSHKQVLPEEQRSKHSPKALPDLQGHGSVFCIIVFVFYQNHREYEKGESYRQRFVAESDVNCRSGVHSSVGSQRRANRDSVEHRSLAVDE